MASSFLLFVTAIEFIIFTFKGSTADPAYDFLSKLLDMAMQQTTTVVTVQPGTTVSATIVQQREWSSGLFGCFEDIGSTLFGCFCPCCYLISLSQRMGEGCAYACCCAEIAPFTLRAKLRTEQAIQGTLFNDALAIYCCGPCAICQMGRELTHVGK